MLRKDTNQLAFSIVQRVTGEAPISIESARAKSGKAGGLKGGAARAVKLTPERRAEIAKKAAETRWKK